MATIEELQKWSDDRMVNAFMAEIDSQIDEIVLMGRVTDHMTIDTIRMDYLNMAGVGFDDALESMVRGRDWNVRNISSAYKNRYERAADLQKMIEQIRASYGFEYIDAERDFYYGPGAYDASCDPYLTYILDMAGLDYADEDTGSIEWDAFVMRFGRVLYFHDDRGSRWVMICDDETQAKDAFTQIDNQYAACLDEEFCGE
jgi:hypothetical protein